MKLPESFFLRGDVTKIARELLGKFIFTRIRGKITGGIIVETEAYSHREKGSHAYRGKTLRNQIMFEPGGVSYVYLCYGIHHLFNVVTNEKGIADAVLVRAVEPQVGEEHMLRRTGAASVKRITSGPGKLTKALGIDRSFNGKYLGGEQIWLEEGMTPGKNKIDISKRIGIDYAGEDAALPWRYTLRGNLWTSKP